jgi:hypothetical protein
MYRFYYLAFMSFFNILDKIKIIKKMLHLLLWRVVINILVNFKKYLILTIRVIGLNYQKKTKNFILIKVVIIKCPKGSFVL